VLGYIFLQYCRENDVGPDTLLHGYFHLPQNVLVSLAGRLLQVAAFGIAIYTAIEVDMCYITLLAYVITNLFRFLIPEFLASSYELAYYLRPDPFRTEAWPKLSFRPLLAESVTDFWGRRWHPLLKRQFVAVGFRPLAALATSIGLRQKGIKLACGALGAFIVSGFIHESSKSPARASTCQMSILRRYYRSWLISVVRYSQRCYCTSAQRRVVQISNIFCLADLGSDA
jgi:hypothetical protein